MNTTSAAEIIATYEGLEVPNAPHFGPTMIRNLNEGRYEAREVRYGLAEVGSADRVVEFGAGAGVVGGIIAKNCQPQKMVSFEANPNLIPHIRTLYSHNQIDDRIEVRNQIVLSQPDAPDAISFYVRGNFLGSGITITKGHEKAQLIDVPVVKWADVKAEVNPTVLIMDIEGAELEFFRDADLSGVRTIVIELHKNIYERAGMKEIRGNLRAAGFEQDAEMSGGGVFVFRGS